MFFRKRGGGGGPETRPNPEGEVNKGPETRPNPEGEVNKGGGIGRRDFLRSSAMALAGMGLRTLKTVGAVGGVGGVGYLGLEAVKYNAENNARAEYQAEIDEFLKDTVHYETIQGIEIYLNKSSITTDGTLLGAVVDGLRGIIDFITDLLPDGMGRRIGRIVLVTVQDNSSVILASYDSQSYVDIGMQLGIITSQQNQNIPPSRIKEHVSLYIDRLVEEFLRGAVRLLVFGGLEDPKEDPKVSRRLRESLLREFQDYMNKHPMSGDMSEDSFAKFVKKFKVLFDLIDSKYLERWFKISQRNGGYVNGNIKIRPLSTYSFVHEELTNSKGFGYKGDDRSIMYGRLNLIEDIACVFKEILLLLYEATRQNKDPVKEIDRLLKKDQHDTDLCEKYLIACEVLMGWDKKGALTDKLQKFIEKIENAIISTRRNTDGQST